MHRRMLFDQCRDLVRLIFDDVVNGRCIRRRSAGIAPLRISSLFPKPRAAAYTRERRWRMKRERIHEMLCGGDRRSLGRANQVAALVSRNPKRFSELMKCLWSEDAVVRMRAADAVEKVTMRRHGLLAPFRAELLGLAEEAEQIEIRWHLALIMPRLQMGHVDRDRAIACLRGFLDDKSAIVKVCALQGLTDMARGDAQKEREVVSLLEECSRVGTAAVRARSRILLKTIPTRAGNSLAKWGPARNSSSKTQTKYPG